MGLKNVLNNAKLLVNSNRPEIMLGMSAGLSACAVILALRNSRKANEAMDKVREKQYSKETPDKKEFIKDVIKEVVPHHIPTIICEGASIALAFGANKEYGKRQAAITSACSIATSALSEFKAKTKELVDEETYSNITDQVSNDTIRNNPPTTDNIEATETTIGPNTFLCYDAYRDRYFRSSANAIRKAENFVNRELIQCMQVSLDEFYEALGLPTAMPGNHSSIGSDFGWSIDEPLDIELSGAIAENDEPCICLSYQIHPMTNFQTLL